MTVYTLLPSTSTTGLMGFNIVTDEISFVTTLFLVFVATVVTVSVALPIFGYHFYMVLWVYDNEKFKNYEKIKKLFKKKMYRAMFMGLFFYVLVAIMYFIDQTIINPAFLETITNFMS